MWSNSLRTAVYSAALVEFLATGKLISLQQVSQILGSEHHRFLYHVCSNYHLTLLVKDEWKDRFVLVVEDYLHGLISLVNELVSLTIFKKNYCFLPTSFQHIFASIYPCADAFSSLLIIVQSRLAVNAVTLGNFEAPIQISIFVKDLFAGFSMVSLKCISDVSLHEIDGVQLNLKNDTLRRRFDSLKYDLKKIEEGGLKSRIL